MKKFIYHGLFTAALSSVVVAFYLYSVYNFVPKGSPDPLVEIDSPMRRELTAIKMIGIYTLISMLSSLILSSLHRFLGKWGVFGMNVLVSAASILGFYLVLSYLRDGWDVFQIIGTPLVYIWPLIWMGSQPIFIMGNSANYK